MTMVPSEDLVVVRLGFTPGGVEDASVTQLVEDVIAATR